MSLHLEVDKPLEGFKSRRRGKRTLGDPGTSPYANGAISGNGGFAAAKINRLLIDFIVGSRSADQDLFGDNKTLRARARKLELDNPHARKFLQMVKQNVVGPAGVQMKAKIRNLFGAETAQTKAISERIEEEWSWWTSGKRCSADGRMTWIDVQQMAILSWAREGETLVKYVFDRKFNDTGIALQILDNDQLDDNLNVPLTDGAQIRMGVEVDKYRRPLAYHLFTNHPNDTIGGPDRDRKRISADFVLHLGMWTRPGQTRGYSQMAAAILSLNQYNRFEEATVVASRFAASKVMSIEQEGIDDWDDDEEDEDDHNAPNGNVPPPTMNGESGEALLLDPGQKANFFDPKFPTSTFGDFSKAILRNISSALLVSYPSLASDLSGVNFSSIRAGLIDERDCWRVIQRWFIDHFCFDVFLKWLKFAQLSTLDDIVLTERQMEQISWRPRGWEWVDPQKDANATILKLGEGLTTYEDECAKVGLDWQDVAEQRKIEQEFFDKTGVVFGVDVSGDQGGKGVAAGDEADVAEEGQSADGKPGAAKPAAGAAKGGKKA